jgi:lipid-binding SYLF domain-containing protein
MFLIAAAMLSTSLVPRPALALSAEELEAQAKASLAQLTASQPSARLLAEKATAILVFPTMLKAGFMFGGQIGVGALLQGGEAVAFYNSVAASYGFQAGVQSFSYALFFMNEQALQQLNDTGGFELGVGPSVVIVDQGVARSVTTATLTSDVYAFVYGQQGLMAGAGIQGSKITQISL